MLYPIIIVDYWLKATKECTTRSYSRIFSVLLQTCGNNCVCTYVLFSALNSSLNHNRTLVMTTTCPFEAFLYPSLPIHSVRLMVLIPFVNVLICILYNELPFFPLMYAHRSAVRFYELHFTGYYYNNASTFEKHRTN